ncbi:pyridoxal phosphate-dependent aminotransferase [Helcobacillus massiliensis]|uniref:pyridoxal phosphate-dependent aminotransferase n=1 Tax=Helcobacillus massiliensis TaxID=521392 RepID=UPI0021A459C5|nr:pyridoxal phosphate-dependent aminotransferase [Helcobacillus massiliensis]MCT1558328.1 pyridoxal phosphate-dependent aminotransferase [Helcobacillus massiliensis]MCT2037323.1 pyridoxal phosphate-dependent aminotransferase [Helcobacillus massiliensis]MCT2332343.1 pyridoxal phosphate-dependent aminotransferase [Helcobacillus massiliensis]
MTAPSRRLSQRIGSIAESATLAVDAKAKALKAAGQPVIGFGAGEPDFPTPSHIVEAAKEAVMDPKNHRYSPAAGLPELREAVAEAAKTYSGVEADASQVLITNGGKQAVYQAFAALIDPGDEVIVPAPFWTSYPEGIRLAGGTPVSVFSGADQDYLPTAAQLESVRTDRTKAVLICSPSNPTGSVLSRAQMEEIGRWALENGLWVITDEIYQHLTYEGTEFTSVLQAVPELADQTVVLNGVAKTFAMTGWRVGWMIAPKDILTGAANMQSHLTSNVNNIAQRAALAALTGPMDSVEDMKTAFARRRTTILDMLSEIDGFSVPRPTGAFYAFPEVSGVLGRTIGGQKVETSTDLATVILDQAKVAAVPGEAFDAPGHLRFSYALSDADLTEGIERVQKLLA